MCSDSCEIYVIALNATANLRASRGFPEAFDPAALTVTPEQRQSLLDFCDTYGIEPTDPEPKWWLSSYWG